MTDEAEQETVEETAPEEEPAPLELTPTPAAEWPSKDKMLAGVIVEMPSGRVARISRPPLQYYIATGNMPPRLWKKIQKEGAEVFDDLVNNFSNEERKLFIDWMISCAFIDPKVSMACRAGNDFTYIGDVDDHDKEEVMRLLGLSLAG